MPRANYNRHVQVSRRVEHRRQNLTCLPHAQSVQYTCNHVPSKYTMATCSSCSVCAAWFAVVGIARCHAWRTSSVVTALVTRWCRFCGISTKSSFRGKLKLNIFSKIPMLLLFVPSSAFCWYLSLARQVPAAPTRTVTDRHDEYYNLAPTWARITICRRGNKS